MPMTPGYAPAMQRLKAVLAQQADRAGTAIFAHPISKRLRQRVYGKDWPTYEAMRQERRVPEALVLSGPNPGWQRHFGTGRDTGGLRTDPTPTTRGMKP